MTMEKKVTTHSLGVETRSAYDIMVLQARDGPALRPAVFNWLFLAGFVLFPGTFTSLSHASLLSQSQTGRTVQGVVRNTPLLVVGILCCTLGIVGVVWISWGLRSNYVWLRDRMLM